MLPLEPLSSCVNYLIHATFLTRDRSLQPEGPSSSTRRRSVRLSSIAEDSRLQPPVGVWAVSQSQCDRSPSKVRLPVVLALVEPLPHQQSNRNRPLSNCKEAERPPTLPRRLYFSETYPVLAASFPTVIPVSMGTIDHIHYSPFRHFKYFPEGLRFSFDLHA